MPNHIHHNYAPFVTLTYTSCLQLHPHTQPIVTPGFVDMRRRSDGTDGRRSWLVDHKREVRLPPPTGKGHGSG